MGDPGSAFLLWHSELGEPSMGGDGRLQLVLWSREPEQDATVLMLSWLDRTWLDRALLKSGAGPRPALLVRLSCWRHADIASSLRKRLGWQHSS